jgi:ribosome-binding protein aMBF1 (putative translation factor)
MSSFGKAVASARKALAWSQKELAAKIKKEDGETITQQYLNDIEHDRRSPSSDHLVGEFARVLKDKSYSLVCRHRNVANN